MKPFKQAYIHFQKNWKESLFIGCIASLLVMLAQLIPVVGPVFLSLGLLGFQLIIHFWIENSLWPKNLDVLKKNLIPLLITGGIMTPTGILLGSAYGLLQGSEDLLNSLPISLSLFVLAMFFYFIVSQALKVTASASVHIIKALDQASLASLRKLKTLIGPCLTFAILFSITQWTWGIGLILVFPMLFYVSHFLYSDDDLSSSGKSISRK